MQTNLSQINQNFDIKIILQVLMLIIVSFLVVVFTNSPDSVIVGLTSCGLAYYSNFIYNPARMKIFLLQVILGSLVGIMVTVLIVGLPIMAVPSIILFCFVIGYGLQSRKLIIFAISLVLTVLMNYSNLNTSLVSWSSMLSQYGWLAIGLVVYLFSCLLFDSYVDEYKLINSKQINQVVTSSWQNISQANRLSNHDMLLNIDQQVEVLAKEAYRLEKTKDEYQYYCALDDNFACKLDENIKKITTFHNLLAYQVYNTILNKNQQLVAEERRVLFDELSD